MTRGLALSRVLVVTFSLIVWARGHEKHFTIEELLHSKFSTRISEDIYLDPCKAGGFQGDIALPNVRYELEYELQRRQDQAAEELAKLKEELHDAEGEDDRDDLDDEANPVTTVDPDHDTGILLITSSTVVPTTTDQPLNGTIMKKPPTMKGPRLSSARKRRRQRKKSKSRRKLSQKKELEKLKKELEALKAKIHQLSSEEKKEDDDGGIDEEEVAPVEKTPKGKQTSSVSSRRRKSRRRSRTGSKSKASTTKNTTSESLDALYEGLLNNVTMLSSSGDLVSRSSRRRRAATARKERVWDFGVIPYEIDANFSGAHKALFKQAMRHWENFTCVKFVERTPDHQHYIVFTERTCGCCSFVGKRGNGPQAISIGKNCDKFGIVVHELGHVVGFWHEHTRPDRDDHVHIIRENIMPGQEYNFNKLTSEEVNSLGLSYDFDSIMHYARNTFSKGTYLDTILPQVNPGTKSRPEIGQRIRLSEGDIAQTNMLYKCSRCGRTFQENKGLFTSPNYPLSSPPEEGERCEWRITATHGERIVLNITELDIFKGETCKYDYLEIRDGYWHRSPLLGRFCGNFRITDTIVSTGSRMLVTYQTSNKQTGHRGFSAHYEALCGGDLETDSGHLESPNYPDDYQSNKECIWRITVPADYQVALRFQSFEIENHDNCVYDYLEIRDGLEPTSKLIGVYCGYKVPDDIKSTGNKMYIKFVSDSSVQKAGFSAYFLKEFDECATLDHGCDHSCINLLGGYECQCKIGFELHSDGKRCEDACGGVIETTNGTIVSPSFPELYPVNKHCVWEIIAPPQYRITLNFTHFDLEGNNQDCEYDHVAIKSKMSESELRNHGAFCGPRLPPVITSEGNSLRISFVSDNTVQKTGFAAVFFTDKDECASNNGGCQHECRNTIGSYVCSCHNGFTLHENGHDCKEGGCKHEITAPFGEILSPNYPDYYPSRKDCIWHFTTTPGHRIKLVFNEFELEPHQECAYDHISIYDGDSSDATTLGKFCGSKVPHPISASSNQMFMVFKSDASVQRKGFQAIHATVCGGHLQATSNVKHFYSHSKYGDQNYDNKEDCDWVIEAPLGTNVHLTFLTFEIEDEQECGYDFVEVFAGFDDSGASYGRFCGNTIPPEIISVNEAILVRFRSDDTINNKGFSASYVAIDESENEDIPKLLLS